MVQGNQLLVAAHQRVKFASRHQVARCERLFLFLTALFPL
jgi:hypothetical protein